MVRSSEFIRSSLSTEAVILQNCYRRERRWRHNFCRDFWKSEHWRFLKKFSMCEDWRRAETVKNKCDDYLFSGVKIHKFTLTADYRHTRLITPMICYSPFYPACIIRDSIVVSIPACHAGDRGSIPRHGELFTFYILWHMWQSLCDLDNGIIQTS